MIPVIDMHCDTISAIAKDYPNRSLRQNNGHLDLLRMKQGGYMCQCFALYTNLDDVKKRGETPFKHACMLSDVFDAEMKKNADLILPVTTGSQIEQNARRGLMSALKTVEEGAVYEGDLKKLQFFYDKGVRKSTLTWNFKNELAYPNPSEYDPSIDEMAAVHIDVEHGLTPVGFEFVCAMESMGMLIDISHLNDAGIRDIFSVVKPDTPIVASHSNARGVCFHPRNLSDEMIRQLASHGGVCGINYMSTFLDENARVVKDHAKRKSRISDMIRHMKYIRNIGGIDVIGLGSDFDGIGGDLEIRGAQDMQKLADALSVSGFTTDEIEKVLYKNALRVYKQVLS